MPWNEVMHKFKAGTLKRADGAPVKSRDEAIAIMLSEKRTAENKPKSKKGKEYAFTKK